MKKRLLLIGLAVLTVAFSAAWTAGQGGTPAPTPSGETVLLPAPHPEGVTHPLPIRQRPQDPQGAKRWWSFSLPLECQTPRRVCR